MQRALRTIDRIGILGPLLGGLPLILLALPGVHIREDWLAAIVIVLTAGSGLLLHFNWIEFLELTRYKYSVVYPRLFAVAGHENWINYLEFTAPRSLRSWIPAFYYNAVAFTVLVALWWRFLLVSARKASSADAWGLCFVAALAILATIRTSHVVLLAARTLERDIKFALGRKWRPPSPFESAVDLIPSGDGRSFMVATPLVVKARRARHDDEIRITIPLGFRTDLASVPQFLWPLFPPWEGYGPAAVVHDYLYCCSEEEWTRKDADKLFLDIMRTLGTGLFSRRCIYLAVRGFGRKARRKATGRSLIDEEGQRQLIERFETEGRRRVL